MNKEEFIKGYEESVVVMSKEDIEYVTMLNKLADIYYASKLTNVGWISKLSTEDINGLWDNVAADVFAIADNKVLYKDFVLANYEIKSKGIELKEKYNPYEPLVYFIFEVKNILAEQTKEEK